VVRLDVVGSGFPHILSTELLVLFCCCAVIVLLVCLFVAVCVARVLAVCITQFVFSLLFWLVVGGLFLYVSRLVLSNVCLL